MNRRNFLSNSLAAVSALAVVDSVRHVEGEVLPKAVAGKVTTITTLAEPVCWTADSDGRWTRRTIQAAPSVMPIVITGAGTILAVYPNGDMIESSDSINWTPRTT